MNVFKRYNPTRKKESSQSPLREPIRSPGKADLGQSRAAREKKEILLLDQEEENTIYKRFVTYGCATEWRFQGSRKKEWRDLQNGSASSMVSLLVTHKFDTQTTKSHPDENNPNDTLSHSSRLHRPPWWHFIPLEPPTQTTKSHSVEKKAPNDTFSHSNHLHRPPYPILMGNKPLMTLYPTQAAYTDYQIPPWWEISP